ncbi:MAG: hypothetical protein ACFFAS_14455 [Promethearchaeota archaeon]
MNDIEFDFSDILVRQNFIFQNEEIKTECLKNHGSFSILGKKFGPFEKGKEYRLKFFIASPFIAEGVLKIASSEKCDNLVVQRYAIAERDDQKLVRREKDHFLNMIKEFKVFMEKDVNKGVRPSVDMDRYKSYQINILDNRLLKLLKLTKTSLSPDNERRMTSSERILYSKVHTLITAWRSFFLT